jgi:DNA-binding response OmpR family regulator
MSVHTQENGARTAQRTREALLMSRFAASRRAGVLAYTLRAREYMRRALRSQHYAPLVFTSLDELGAMGPGARTLDLLLLGDLPERDEQGLRLLTGIRNVVGPHVPMLSAHFQPAPSTSTNTVSTHFFSDLYSAIISFLAAHGFETSRPLLAWDDYAFDPSTRFVTFERRETRLDPVAFDVALELFFNAEQRMTRGALRRMLPSGERGRILFRIDNIGSVIKDVRSALQLRGAHGWTLETFPHAGYRLTRTARRPRTTPSPLSQPTLSCN